MPKSTEFHLFPESGRNAFLLFFDSKHDKVVKHSELMEIPLINTDRRTHMLTIDSVEISGMFSNGTTGDPPSPMWKGFRFTEKII